MGYFARAAQILIDCLFVIAIFLLVLRVMLQAVRANFYNPVCQFLYKATNPVLMPLRKLIPSWRNVDIGALLLAWLLSAIKLALIYALLDRASAINAEHLHAALALHHYAVRSAAWALEPQTGDPIAEHLHTALRHAPDGLTRSQLLDLLHRNVPARRLDKALATLAAAGKADRQRILTGGRPAELFRFRREILAARPVSGLSLPLQRD